MKKIFSLSFLLVLLLCVGIGWKIWDGFLNSAPSDSPEEVTFEVKPGQTLHSVARDLEKQGFVRRANFFLLLAKLTDQSNQLKVGEYMLRKNMRPKEVLEVITSGHSVGRNFTVAEGLNLFEISDLYETNGFGSKKEFWKWVNDPEFAEQLLGEKVKSLEGYLYPETYQITKYTDTKSVIRAMVARFLDIYRRNVEPLAKESKMTRHQIVTLASIIEKETGAPEERATISSVFHNRLNKGMLLQTDPTVLYGKARKLGKMEIVINRSDLSAPTEYNTYVIRGLPPGPIASPGEAAMLAALAPANTDYLYFVSQNNGTHIFSKDLGAHNRAVQKYQVSAKAREGHSWRELKKARASENLQSIKSPPSSTPTKTVR